jgi:hypothetical protein
MLAHALRVVAPTSLVAAAAAGLETFVLALFGYYGEQVFPDLPLVADVLKHFHELGVSHILDVDAADSKFQVPDGLPGLVVLESRDQRVYRVE